MTHFKNNTSWIIISWDGTMLIELPIMLILSSSTTTWFCCSPWPRLFTRRNNFVWFESLRHVSTVSASRFYWLRQLRRSRRSLDAASTATLVHAFVSSRIDYCNAVLAGSPKLTTYRLQRVLNTAARVISGTQKYDWPRLVAAAAHWAPLAWCTPASQVQAQRYGAQLSEWPSTPVPDQLLPLTLCSHISAVSQIRQPTTSRRTTLPTEFFCQTSFFCGRPVGLELIAILSERPGRRQKQF